MGLIYVKIIMPRARLYDTEIHNIDGKILLFKTSQGYCKYFHFLLNTYTSILIN